jgi:hypothetical protein
MEVRMTHTNSPIVKAMVLVTLALAGCHSLHHDKASTALATSQAIAGTAQVADGVLQGQRLNIPASGLSLDEALASTLRPGALSSIYQDGDEILNPALDHWVSIRRGLRRTFIPLYLVQNSIGGSIQVVPGDMLSLERSDLIGSSTGLDETDDSRLFVTREGVRSYVVSGLTEVTGLLTTEKNAAQSTVNSIPGAKSLNGVTPSLAVLTRSAGAFTDQFLLPIDAMGQFGINHDFRLNKAGIREGDHIHFTRLELLDIVRAGVRRSRIAKEQERRADAEEKRKCLAMLHEHLESETGLTGAVHRTVADVHRRISQIPHPNLSGR